MKHSAYGTPSQHTHAAFSRLIAGEHDDPFGILGPHPNGDGSTTVAVFLPEAATVFALQGNTDKTQLEPVPDATGVFQGVIDEAAGYRLHAIMADGNDWTFEDPYRFGPVIGELDEYLIGEGTHAQLWDVLGAHVREHEGVTGTHFAVWAPNARRVSVVGGFNNWDGRRHPMRRAGASGIWEIFIPGIGEGEAYKYELLGADGTLQPLKADPVGFGSQHPPENASVVRDIRGYGWNDAAWMAKRHAQNDRNAPICIYEVHLGSWRRKNDGRPLSYREAAVELIDYVAEMGFTHIELMPVSEYPFDGSWGYQPVGLFAPTIRHGPPHEFRNLVEAAHNNRIGVILDWVPGHFPTDPHGLGRFDGTALYEHADPREGFHQDWNTLIYNYGRAEVKNFLVANARYWLDEYHVDGLRVDAVASMLYRDYSRKAGEWVPNKDGGRENYEAIDMLREVNTATYGAHPGIMTVAEESTAFPGVSRPVSQGGLGFGFKWNMGWMNDTIEYMKKDPVHRKHHHHRMTFGLTYAFSENFVLPISHDEVVHGKGSMLGKMPGGVDDRFANLRAYYAFMWGHPGKKLLFMGQEFGQAGEWNHSGELDWAALKDARHAGLQRLVRDLNTIYRGEPGLHEKDTEPDGFQWIEADAAQTSVYAWLRRGSLDAPNVVVVCNFTPVEQPGYRIGLPMPGTWREALNTDAEIYGGQGRGNMGAVEARPEPHNDQAASAEIYLPPLSVIFLVHDRS
ncbi:1,4-alpha-glucan branching protein GlgB [Tateyamaria pelophila]|uniref:1,4-alpha-glucan branching protein GlgB n=1 Tax=Tateyamaria pelophila TaxID=328415 RepID=UPI001CBDD05A|nr:1,4-alpha-glucan branching protein GlgB [Tateyamaria pelophila]